MYKLTSGKLLGNVGPDVVIPDLCRVFFQLISIGFGVLLVPSTQIKQNGDPNEVLYCQQTNRLVACQNKTQGVIAAGFPGTFLPGRIQDHSGVIPGVIWDHSRVIPLGGGDFFGAWERIWWKNDRANVDIPIAVPFSSAAESEKNILCGRSYQN